MAYACACGLWDLEPPTYRCSFCDREFEPDPKKPFRFCSCVDFECCHAPIEANGECSNGCSCENVHAHDCSEEPPIEELTCSDECKRRLPRALEGLALAPDWRAA
ncbi:MAG: hypothetical protein F4Y02_17970 [Chloroflexi bacterium]|nr:hypothetical protein [Chloroflexota bacterium]